MNEDLKYLKQRIPLLDYLQQLHWSGQRAGSGDEWVGPCPLHRETRPSFYVNTRKNLFYCHGCGRGGDLIRLVELTLHLSFSQSVERLRQQLAPATAATILDHTAAFYQVQLDRHPEAVWYLDRRGLRDSALIEELGLGYAPGRNLLPHLAARGYGLDLALRTGLISPRGGEAFCRRIVFPCRQDGRIVNLYGRSIGAAFPHRLLPRSKGGLFAWNQVRDCSTLILVEGLFDLASLWQAGFRNTTCAVGTHLTPVQWTQLCDQPSRQVYIVFDQDENQAGQQASRALAQRLRSAGLAARIVQLPATHDPNSFFCAGATAADFTRCLEQTQ